MTNPDIRWHQRLNNYNKALLQLTKAVELSKQRPLSNLEKQGLIKSFEFTHELAWNVMKDYFEDQGNSSITGSKDATREAFRRGLIIDGQGWMEMLKSRNKGLLSYEAEILNEITDKIMVSYFVLFNNFKMTMKELAEKSSFPFSLN